MIPPRKILVIDDDESNLSLLNILFRRAGYEVVPATDGTTAVSLADPTIHVAFVDMHLPDMSGTAVIRHLRQTMPEIIITVATMDDDPQTVKAAFQAGCDLFLVKPYDVKQIIQLVEQTQRGQRLIFDRLGKRVYGR